VNEAPTKVLALESVAPAKRQETRVLAKRLAVTGPVNLRLLWVAGAGFLALGLLMIRAGASPVAATGAGVSSRSGPRSRDRAGAVAGFLRGAQLARREIHVSWRARGP
jgi:hypothetical protein